MPRYPVNKSSQKAISSQGNMVQKIIKKFVAEIPRLNWNLSENRNAQDNEQMIQLNEGHNNGSKFGLSKSYIQLSWLFNTNPGMKSWTFPFFIFEIE